MPATAGAARKPRLSRDIPLGLRPLGTLRPLEQILTLLIKAGFSPDGALHVYRAYYGFLYGHILNELQEFVVDPEENEVLLRLGLHRLPAKEFPRLRALAPALAKYDGAAELDQGLTILLSGLEAQLSMGTRPPGPVPLSVVHGSADAAEWQPDL